MSTNRTGFNAEQCQRQVEAWQKRLVDDGAFPQMQTIVSYRGEIVCSTSAGERRPGVPLGDDTIFRIYSLTKPIVAVALMQLIEQDKAQLSDPISKCLPPFENMNVLVQDENSTVGNYETVPAKESITIKHLLTNTSGISGGFDETGELLLLDGIYNQSKILKGYGPYGICGHSCTLSDFCNELAKQPLLFEPGTAWHYGLSFAVCGRLIEVLSGETLGEYLEKHIFAPLGMKDTSFILPEDKKDRLVSLHFAPGPGEANQDVTNSFPNMYDPNDEASMMQDGGAGLVSTAADYMKFCECLLRGGDVGNGERILKKETLELMTENHLPDNKCLADAVADTPFAWLAKTEPGESRSSWGLGFAIILDPITYSGKPGASPGTFSWVGAAKTIMWIDPMDDLAVVCFSNLLNANHVREELIYIVYGCLDGRNVEPS